ncbi:hypothetical protein AB0P21_35625 [Kribbella sp. NPDC056861]|uniref:hypothetical protein n=1 Tax=Kribbella sp. NPDC056861 TaxID=3154857 RepID=UPI00344AC858
MRSQSGQVLASAAAHPDFDPVLSEVDRSAYPILGHVDPYGDTILNRLQVESLLGEIDALRGNGDVIPKTFAEDLIGLCDKCLSKPHRFLWFIGD